MDSQAQWRLPLPLPLPLLLPPSLSLVLRAAILDTVDTVDTSLFLAVFSCATCDPQGVPAVTVDSKVRAAPGTSRSTPLKCKQLMNIMVDG